MNEPKVIEQPSEYRTRRTEYYVKLLIASTHLHHQLKNLHHQCQETRCGGKHQLNIYFRVMRQAKLRVVKDIAQTHTEEHDEMSHLISKVKCHELVGIQWIGP